MSIQLDALSCSRLSLALQPRRLAVASRLPLAHSYVALWDPSTPILRELGY